MGKKLARGFGVPAQRRCRGSMSTRRPAAPWRVRAGTKDGAFGKSVNDDTNDWQAAYALFPGRIAYVLDGQPRTSGGRSKDWTPADSSDGRSSSGTRGTSSSVVVTTTGGTRPAGTPFRRARRPTGRVTGKPRPSGRLTTHENRRPATRHRSRSSACRRAHP